MKKFRYEINPDGSRRALPTKKVIPEMAFHCHTCRAVLSSKNSLKYHTKHNICGTKVCNTDHDHNFVEFQFDCE